MSEKLNLTLPERRTGVSASPRGNPWLILVTILVAANLVLTLLRGSGGRREASSPAGLEGESLRKLALKLEQQDLPRAAVTAWKEFLAGEQSPPEDAARIWYRIGKISQESGDYESALDAYYRSESLAELAEVKNEIGRRTQESLEALGKFAALRYELSTRVGLENGAEDAGTEIVAEIGSEKISRADLDRAIEKRIDAQLAEMAGLLPEEDRKRQKEEMLKQFAGREPRLQFLNQLLTEEVLYRQARADGVTSNPEVREALRDLERSLLARRVLRQAFADQVNLTESDLRTFYEANQNQYRTAPRARISHILVSDEEDAETALASLQGGESFEDMAGLLSEENTTKVNGGEIDGWVSTTGVVPGIGDVPEARDLIFQTPAGEVASRYVKTDQGYHLIKVREREPERQKPFDEVRPQVYQTLHGRKEQELYQKMLEELKDQYDVVIHRGAFDQTVTESDGQP